jgi:cobalamin biosynthesis Mg chelatase CobN
MQYRPGTCSECSAQYKLPASFKADKAKCKKCGGIVNIGPAAEEEPKQVELVEHKPSGKQRSGPSMKERLMAEREAAAAASAKPKAKPAPAKSTAKKAPVRRARAAAKDGDGGETKRPARAGARRGAGAGSRSSARRAGRGKNAEGEEGEEEGGRTRRGAPQKKSAMGPILITLGLVIVAGLGAWWKLGTSTNAEAGNSDETVSDANESTNPDDANPAAGTTPEDDAVPKETKPAPADAGEDEGNTPEETPPPVDAAPKELVMVTDPADLARNATSGKYKIAIVKASNSEKLNDRISKLYPDALYDVNDPAEIAIQDLEPFPRFEGTSAEDWAKIQENVDLMLENSGRKSDVAGRALESGFDPRHVTPAIINAMLTMDYADDAGARNAEYCLQRLNKVVKRRFGWTYDVDEPNKGAIANRRTTAELYSVWSRILSGEKEWSSWYMGGKGPAPDADRESADELGG